MGIFEQILYYVNFFFLAYTILYSLFLFVSVIVGSMTLYHMKKERRLKNYYIEDIHVPISIIVPAYNEEVTIVDSINSLLKLDYKTYEIVIVDDGSKDNTSKVLISTFNMIKIDAPIQKVVNCAKEEYVYKTFAYKVPITLVRKVNGGSKADANNMGINVSRYPYFLCMDADSVLQSNSLREISMPITEDDSVVAVGGSVRILNDVTIKEGKIAHFEFAHNPLAAYQAM